MRESTIEKYLIRRCEQFGGVSYKFTSPGRRNVPDRVCIFPRERRRLRIFFVECKATGAVSSPAQLREQARLRHMGFAVYEVDSKDGVDEVLQKWV